MARIEVRAVAALTVFLVAILVIGETLPSSSGSRPTASEQSRAPRSWNVEMLMAGTPHETPAYVSVGDEAARGALLIGGAHGDEPSGWLALETLPDAAPAIPGTLVVLPRANVVAIDLELRSTPELGDLNRLYGYAGDALPMGVMAREILMLVTRHRIDAVLDLHESWWMLADQPEDADEPSSAFLGQTVSPHLDEKSRKLARDVVSKVNRKLPRDEEFAYHEFPPDYEEEEIVPLPAALADEPIPNKSSLAIPDLIPEVATVLVEVGQQQPIESRVEQQTLVIDAFLEALAKG